MDGQMTIFDFLPVEAVDKTVEEVAEIAERMKKTFGLTFRCLRNDGYYLLYVCEDENHRFVIDGTNKRLGFGIDGFFLAHKGFGDIAERYKEWMDR